MLFATCVRNKGVLCASARSPQNRLTALWAVGRFLPWWASSPAWQRRLDVIKVYTLSAVWGCVKWALLLPKAWTVIVYLRRACEISKKGSQHRRPDVHIHLAVSFTCTALVFQMFFFSLLYALLLHLKVGEEVTSLTRRFSSCRCQDSFLPYEKKLLRNMIAPVKRTNYSPLTTFKTHFYWPIQPNKTLLHKRKGTPSFLHSFSKPSVYMIPVITPLWHLNFIEQDFKICRQYIKHRGIYFFQMGEESPNSWDLSGADWRGFVRSNNL